MNLDLENPYPFWKVIAENKKGHKRPLEICRENNYLVSSVGAYGKLPSILSDALNLFVVAAEKRIVSVTAYHGCRVFLESDYSDRGIRKLETSRVVDWCKRFFGNENRIDETVTEFGSDYTRHGELGVFCMKGIEAAKANGCRHSDGSELIRSIASRLGPEEGKIFCKGASLFH